MAGRRRRHRYNPIRVLLAITVLIIAVQQLEGR